MERLTNSLMMHGRNNGKKLMAVRIVKHAFEIIHLLTAENPLQVIYCYFFASYAVVAALNDDSNNSDTSAKVKYNVDTLLNLILSEESSLVDLVLR